MRSNPAEAASMSFDFVPVSVETARQSLDEPVHIVRGASGHRRGSFDPHPHWRRRPDTERDRRLTTRSFTWLYEMPRAQRPIQLALRFPRILNNVADFWDDIPGCAAYLGELLVDRRGNRRGFPAPVMTDLMRLRAYHAQLHSLDLTD